MKLSGISREGMVEIDRIMTQELGIDVELMMEHAGLNLARIVRKYFDEMHGEGFNRILVIAGSGNNGAGGIVAARRLHSWGMNVAIWFPKGDPKREIPIKQMERAEKVGIPVVGPQIKEDDLIVDAFIGYNFRGEFDEIALRVIKVMRSSKIISLDIPSGIDATTGRNVGDIKPLATLTLAWPKVGMLLLENKEIGDLYLADIGVPLQIYYSKSVFGQSFFNQKYEVEKVYEEFQKNSILKLEFEEGAWGVNT